MRGGGIETKRRKTAVAAVECRAKAVLVARRFDLAHGALQARQLRQILLAVAKLVEARAHSVAVDLLRVGHHRERGQRRASAVLKAHRAALRRLEHLPNAGKRVCGIAAAAVGRAQVGWAEAKRAERFARAARLAQLFARLARGVGLNRVEAAQQLAGAAAVFVFGRTRGEADELLRAAQRHGVGHRRWAQIARRRAAAGAHRLARSLEHRRQRLGVARHVCEAAERAADAPARCRVAAAARHRAAAQRQLHRAARLLRLLIRSARNVAHVHCGWRRTAALLAARAANLGAGRRCAVRHRLHGGATRRINRTHTQRKYIKAAAHVSARRTGVTHAVRVDARGKHVRALHRLSAGRRRARLQLAQIAATRLTIYAYIARKAIFKPTFWVKIKSKTSINRKERRSLTTTSLQQSVGVECGFGAIDTRQTLSRCAQFVAQRTIRRRHRHGHGSGCRIDKRCALCHACLECAR